MALACRQSLFFKNIANSLTLTPNPFPSVKGCVCFVGSASCRAFGHTRPASVPGLSVGLPPSPRLGLRPKPHFQKLYRFIDSLKTTVAYTQRWFFILLYVFENQPFCLRNTHQYNRSDNSKHYLRQHIRPVIKQAVKARLVYGKAVPQLSE